jgi:hypothetical protein
MIFFPHHGMFELGGIGLLGNSIGFIVAGLAVMGVLRARGPKGVALSLAIALVGLILLICGTTFIVASE